MSQPDQTLINDERLLAEAIAAADRLHDKPRAWMARYGGYVTLGKCCPFFYVENKYPQVSKGGPNKCQSKRCRININATGVIA